MFRLNFVRLFNLNSRFQPNQYQFWALIMVIFAIVIVMEYTTHPDYVFGYLYTGAILLTSRYYNHRLVVIITLIAVGLTSLNLFVPILKIDSLSTIANRLIAIISLIITGWLTIRNRLYEEEIAHQQLKIKTQEQLVQIRENFLSTLTHDLKTPLLGAIETLKSFQGGLFGFVTPKQQKVLKMMISSHQSTLNLVETILDIYRNDNEGLQLKLEVLNLKKILEEIVNNLTDFALSRRIYLHISGDSLWVRGDSLQLRRVFMNLLTNAINHSPRGSNVEIVLESKEREQQVSFLDNGLGISPEDIPQIFERFYQGVNNRQTKGSGLGLYLSRQIIEAHGGRIWAENRPTQGAIFRCCLPALDNLYDNS